jgi:hypothetical protein
MSTISRGKLNSAAVPRMLTERTQSFPNPLNAGRPAPPEMLKPTFKTQQHFGHGSVK